VSWSGISIDELERMIPVRPPIVNRKTNPNAQRKGVSWPSFAPCIVAHQLKILIPVGTAITMVAAVK